MATGPAVCIRSAIRSAMVMGFMRICPRQPERQRLDAKSPCSAFWGRSTEGPPPSRGSGQRLGCLGLFESGLDDAAYLVPDGHRADNDTRCRQN